MRRAARRAPALGFAALAPGALLSSSASAQPAPAGGMAQVFPHVRADVQARIVEFDAVVPIVLDDPESDVFLEVLVCTPDTKEHETLLVTQARPSNVHAALLLLGLVPGRPGAWRLEGDHVVPEPPVGPAVRVEFAWKDAAGAQRVEPAWSWVRRIDTGETLGATNWVFAGSKFIRFTPPAGAEREVYDADYSGALVGLSTFGGETLALPTMHSPEESVEEPVWIADSAKAPPLGTPVVVRLSPAPPGD